MAVAQESENLLDGENLREKLELLLPHAKNEIIFISAYITQSAIDWLASLVADGSKVHVICRLLPSDVMGGSTHLSALQTALENNMTVSCLHSLHAKIYCIDNETIFVGSANLTNNGLKIYGMGNIEACAQVPVNNLNLNFINKIVESSTQLDEEILQNMQGCIDLKETSILFDAWPEGVLKEEEGIWVRDFFWASPGTNEQSLEWIHDAELLGIANGEEITKDRILRARCIQWLVRKLEIEPEQELYFGTLTKILHDELKDDPAPYRKDVKSLLQNLLEYIQKYLPDMIEVSRPQHSQRIKLLVAS